MTPFEGLNSFKPFDQVLMGSKTPTEKALINLLGAIISNHIYGVQGMPQSAVINSVQGSGYTRGQCVAALNQLANAGAIAINTVNDGSLMQPFRVYVCVVVGGGL